VLKFERDNWVIAEVSHVKYVKTVNGTLVYVWKIINMATV